ncbi:hypothetical protein [Pseudomonas kermanshahensis]|uniref:hypothetical protein n=1 Tax=Pseudomonas kermanshahensis TaxID=2745482 RepID=UPI002092438A|nr:hypothetical protein [Pseudomonas kermanshahensis]USS54203.1 hypothetical protein NG836_20650 [Pseudomonas kermanshahensis]
MNRQAQLPDQSEIVQLKQLVAKLQADLTDRDQRIDQLVNGELEWMDPRRAKVFADGRNAGLNEASELCNRMGWAAYYPPGTRYRAFVPKARTALGDLLIKAANAIADLPDGPYERFKARQAKKKS